MFALRILKCSSERNTFSYVYILCYVIWTKHFSCLCPLLSLGLHVLCYTDFVKLQKLTFYVLSHLTATKDKDDRELRLSLFKSVRDGFCTILIPTSFCIVYSIPQNMITFIEDEVFSSWSVGWTSVWPLFSTYVRWESCYEPLSECTTRNVIVCIVTPNTLKTNGCWN